MADEHEPTAILGAANTTIGPITVQATAKLRVNFGIPHLLAAARFSRRVGEIESENKGQAFGSFFEEIMACSNACVLSAVAGLESYVNELFADREQNFPRTSARLSEMIFRLSEQKPINEKFDIALTVLDLQPFDRGRCPAQDVDILIGLRNAIVHFKPEWDDALVNHGKLSEKLKSKINGTCLSA